MQHAAPGLFVSSLPRGPIGLAKRERATQNGTSFLAREPSMTNRTDLQDLMTVRDWLRYGVTRFEEAALTYGHEKHCWGGSFEPHSWAHPHLLTEDAAQ